MAEGLPGPLGGLERGSLPLANQQTCWYIAPMMVWLQNHPLTVSVILFVFACLVSVLAQDIRGFSGSIIGRRKESSAVQRLTFVRDELAKLQRLHDNAYQLLLWLAEDVPLSVLASTCATLVAAGVVAGVAATANRFGLKTPPLLWATFATGVFVGTVIAAAMSVYRTVRALSTYDASCAKLQARIEKLGCAASAGK